MDRLDLEWALFNEWGASAQTIDEWAQGEWRGAPMGDLLIAAMAGLFGIHMSDITDEITEAIQGILITGVMIGENRFSPEFFELMFPPPGHPSGTGT